MIYTIKYFRQLRLKVDMAVEKTRSLMHVKYITKARSADQVYGGVEQGTKLLSFGACIRTFWRMQ